MANFIRCLYETFMVDTWDLVRAIGYLCRAYWCGNKIIIRSEPKIKAHVRNDTSVFAAKMKAGRWN